MSYDANGSPIDGPLPTILPPPLSGAWAGVKGLLMGFSVLGEDSFPAHLCVVLDSREDDVYNSTDEDYHLVVAVDARFQCSATIRLMRPFRVTASDMGSAWYGWVDKDGNFVSHGEHPVYEPDHAKVVAWKPCLKDFNLRA